MLEKVAQYLEERSKWVEAGKPTRTKEEIFKIFEICSGNTCGHYQKISEDHGKCGLCGCHLKRYASNFNKAAFKTSYCPDEPSLWGDKPETVEEVQAIIEEKVEDVEVIEKPLIVEKSMDEPKLIKRCCGKN